MIHSGKIEMSHSAISPSATTPYGPCHRHTLLYTYPLITAYTQLSYLVSSWRKITECHEGEGEAGEGPRGNGESSPLNDLPTCQPAHISHIVVSLQVSEGAYLL